MVERAHDGISIIQDEIIKYCNPRLAELLGSAIEEVIDVPFTNFIHPDALPAALDRQKRQANGEEIPPNYETVLKCKDGSKLLAEVNTGLIFFQGKSANLAIVRDITERKQAEKAIQQHIVELETLYESGLTFSELLSPKEIAQKLIDLMSTKLDWHHTTIRMYHPADESLELLAFSLPTAVTTVEYHATEEQLRP